MPGYESHRRIVQKFLSGQVYSTRSRVYSYMSSWSSMCPPNLDCWLKTVEVWSTGMAQFMKTIRIKWRKTRVLFIKWQSAMQHLSQAAGGNQTNQIITIIIHPFLNHLLFASQKLQRHTRLCPSTCLHISLCIIICICIGRNNPPGNEWQTATHHLLCHSRTLVITYQPPRAKHTPS